MGDRGRMVLLLSHGDCERVLRFDRAFVRRLFEGRSASRGSAEELANWWAQLKQAEAAGQLYLALFGFVVGGRKPQLV